MGAAHVHHGTHRQATREGEARPKYLTSGECNEAVEAASERLARAIAAVTNQADVAARLGVSEQYVSQCCSPSSPKLLSGGQRERLLRRCPDVARELLRLEADSLDERAPYSLRPLQHVAMMAGKVGCASGAAIAIEADGRIDEADRPHLLELRGHISDLRRELDSADRDIDAALGPRR